MESESQQIPSLVPDVDVYSLPLDTTEGFVLSCVDGALSVEDISFMSGISMDQLVRILDRLVELGAVRWSEPTHYPPSGLEKYESQVRDTPGRERKQSDRRPATRRREGHAPGPKPPPAAPHDRLSFTPSRRPGGGPTAGSRSRRGSGEQAMVSEDEIDLEPELKKKIYETHRRMEGQNYYELLGVSQKASRQLIRSAYFELSRTFHPDSVFGRRLGHYKPKMEAVFKRLTEAYDVLSRSKKRKEYDEYLAATVRARHLTAALEAEKGRSEPRDSERPTMESTPVDEPTESDAPVSEIHAAIVPPPATDEPEELPAGSLKPPRVPTERRIQMQKALRKRLDAVVGRTPPPRSSPIPTVPPPSDYPQLKRSAEGQNEQKEEKRSNAIRGLFRSLKEASEASGGANKLDLYIRQARQSEEDGDLLAAANSLRLALSIDPDNEQLKADHERINSTLAKTLTLEYEKRAAYEEKASKWEAAAASWCKVCEGRPDAPDPARRAAEALLKAGGDPRRAQKYAQKAVELEPDKAENLLLLARVFMAADMKLNAKRELEKAAKLDPANEMVKNLLQEVR